MSQSLRSHARLNVEQLETRDTPAVIPGFSETLFASGLLQPTAMAVAPDGRIFVAEKGGDLRIVQNGTVLPTPFLSLDVNTASERGLIGVALDPNFATNRFVYVYYTTDDPTPVNRVSRFLTDPNNPNAALAGEDILLDNIPSTNGNHNGGALVFAPDGTLFIGVGDAGIASNSQTLTNLSGKVLRINPNGSIPLDNPFINTQNARVEIWAYGLRNPFTLAVQPGTGRLFINDVGGTLFEEVNKGIAGANYGWPDTEGDFDPNQFPQYMRPIYAYSHGSGPLQGNSIAGGAFYNPAVPTFPAEYLGDYFFGDFVNSRIFVRDNGTGAVTTFADPTAGGGVVDLDVLPDGSLLYLSFFTGTIYRITPSQTPPTPIFAAATGGGTPAQLNVSNGDGSLRFTVNPYAGYAGGVRVATGDVTGDQIEDVITGTSAGAPPHVKVFEGATGGLARNFFAFDPAYLGGVFVAAGDVTGDNRADIIVSSATGASHVKVFDGVTGAEIASFFAFEGFTGGVTVAAGDIDGDNRTDIIVGTATGFSHVKVFSGRTSEVLRSFFAFDNFNGGVTVGYANGTVLVGSATLAAHVKAFGANNELVRSFFAFAGFPGGVRVAGSGNTILAGAGPGAGPHLKAFDLATGDEILSRFVFNPSTPGGIFVG